MGKRHREGGGGVAGSREREMGKGHREGGGGVPDRCGRWFQVRESQIIISFLDYKIMII
jgi:hypothetical protein